MKYNKGKKIGWVYLFLLIIFLLIIAKLTLTPYYGEITYERQFNLTPFLSITNYYEHFQRYGFFSNGTFTVSFINLLGNLLLFLPYGILLPLSFYSKKIKLFATVFSAFVISASIEILQYYFLVSRRADIDDIIFNVISALLGYIIYRIFFRKHYNFYKKG